MRRNCWAWNVHWRPNFVSSMAKRPGKPAKLLSWLRAYSYSAYLVVFGVVRNNLVYASTFSGTYHLLYLNGSQYTSIIDLSHHVASSIYACYSTVSDYLEQILSDVFLLSQWNLNWAPFWKNTIQVLCSLYKESDRTERLSPQNPSIWFLFLTIKFAMTSVITCPITILWWHWKFYMRGLWQYDVTIWTY